MAKKTSSTLYDNFLSSVNNNLSENVPDVFYKEFPY